MTTYLSRSYFGTPAGTSLRRSVGIGAVGDLHWPGNATELAGVMGAGTWASAWQMDEASGNLVDVIGGITMTAVGTPNYRKPGAVRAPIEYGVGFDDDTSDGFVAASTATYDLALGTSIALYMCFRFPAAFPSNRWMMSKIGAGNGYGIVAAGGGTGNINGYIQGTGNVLVTATAAHDDGKDHDMLLLIDRTGQRIQLVTDLAASAATDISTITSPTNAVHFAFGIDASNTPGMVVSYAAVCTAGVDTLRANAAAAITNIRRFTGRG